MGRGPLDRERDLASLHSHHDDVGPLRHARLGEDLTEEPDVDEEAGDLGVPFTQPDHDEEWEEWVGWSAVGA